jgi:hypothetical protein
MKKTWIKVKRGLIEPKHREQLGEAWFMYLYCLDVADWTTGVIADWKDKDVADELGLSLPTVRRHRVHLEENGYLASEKRPYGLRINILNWTDPRLYDDPEPETTQETIQESDRVRAHERIADVSTPTSSSHTTDHIPVKDSPPPKELEYIPLVNNGETEFTPAPKTAKEKRKEQDGLLEHPALKTYRGIARLNVDFTWRQRVIDAVGEDVERWGKHIDDWIGAGWNKTNIKGLLESFQSGGIKNRRNGNKPDAKSRFEARVEELRRGN